MKKTFVFIALLGLFASSYSQSDISGKALYATGATVRLYEYSGLRVPPMLVQKDSSVVDQNGNFKFTVDYPDFREIFIEGPGSSGVLYVRPGGSYEITLEKNSSILRVNKEPPDCTNLLVFYVMENFTMYYDSLQFFIPEGGLKEVQEQIISVKRQYVIRGNNFFKLFVFYYFTEKEIQADLVSSEGLAAFVDTLINNTVALNKQYSFYFSCFRAICKRQFQNAVIKKQEITIPDILKLKVVFKNDTLQELAYIEYMRAAIHSDVTDRAKILSSLDSILNGSKYNFVRVAARTVYEQFNRLLLQTPAPAFALPDSTGKIFTISDFNDKPVLMITYSNKFTPDEKYLQKLQAKYSGKLNLIGLFCKRDTETFNEYLRNNAPLHPMLYAADDKTFMYNYQLSCYKYILIDKNGMIERLIPLNKEKELEKIIREME